MKRSTRFVLLGLLGAQAMTAEAPADKGAYFEDTSGSPMASVRLEMRRQVMDSMPVLAREGSIRRWDLYGFFQDSFSVPKLGSVSLPPFSSPLCATAKRSEGGALLKQLAIREDAAAAEGCLNALKEHETRWAADAAKEVDKARTLLAAAPLERGSCTAIRDLLDRISLDDDPALRLVIVVTDGDETCRPNARTAIPPPSVKRKVLLILTGAASSATASHYRLNLSHWKAVAPWADVVPSFGLASAIGLFQQTAK